MISGKKGSGIKPDNGVKSLKSDKKRRFGRIESKIVAMILSAMLLVAGVFLGVSLTRSNMLAKLTEETTERQLSSMTKTTNAVINTVIEEDMDRVTDMEAQSIDRMFENVSIRVRMVGDYARKLLDEPDSVPRMPWSRPDASKDGELFVKVLFADGVNEEEVTDKLGVIANMSGMMISLCNAYGADNVWFSLAEGATLMADTVPGNWIGENGSYIAYNAPDRYWYRQAAEKGELIFTDVETDKRTGELCVTCALPVYGADGALLGVAGADLYLTEMKDTVVRNSGEDGFLVVVNQDGHVIISPEGQDYFRVLNSDRAADLRGSDNLKLAELVTDALQGKTDVRIVELTDGTYYMLGAPMKTVGWTMIAAFSASAAEVPAQTLQKDFEKVQQEAAEEYRNKSARGQKLALAMLAGLLVVLLTGAFLAGRRIAKPLNGITRQISELGEDNLEFKMRDEYRTGDEVEVLANSFAGLSHKTIQYIDQVKTVTAEKERIGTELQLAQQIQSGMLPSVFPPYPERSEFDLYATMIPAREVGGDFYDFFLVDEDHLALVMADVSGKSVPGALFMMVSKAILKNNAMQGKSPAEILNVANETICSNNKMEMFVTVWIGIMEISTGRIVAANAGHEYPAICRKGGSFELYKDRHGFVVGGMEGVRYKEYELNLKPGDRLFLYTDGVPEATDANGELFGTERMTDALNRGGSRPEDLLKEVRRNVDDFVGDSEQFDDLTMLCLEYKGKRKQTV